jgi:NADH dehydrogenase [ubiquinone] 1 alpha subcomplex assembly factor 7
MGLQLRVDALARAAPTEVRKIAITDATRRLVDRTGMGTAYKVLGVTCGVSKTVGGKAQETWPFVQEHGGDRNGSKI